MAAVASAPVPRQARPTAGSRHSRVWLDASGAATGSQSFRPPADWEIGATAGWEPCARRVRCIDASLTVTLKTAPFQHFSFSISLPATFRLLVTLSRQSFCNWRGQSVVIEGTKCAGETRGDGARLAVGLWKARLGGWGVRAKEAIGATAGGIRPRGWVWGLGGGGPWGGRVPHGDGVRVRLGASSLPADPLQRFAHAIVAADVSRRHFSERRDAPPIPPLSPGKCPTADATDELLTHREHEAHRARTCPLRVPCTLFGLFPFQDPAESADRQPIPTGQPACPRGPENVRSEQKQEPNKQRSEYA